MIRIELSEEEKRALDYERYHHPHPHVQRKMEALWLKSQQLPHKDICRFAGISKHTLCTYLQAYGTLWIRRNELVEGWSRVRTAWMLIQGDKAATFHCQLTLYSGYELKERLEQAGFGTVRLFGDLQGNAYGPEASRLIAVAWTAP